MPLSPAGLWTRQAISQRLGEHQSETTETQPMRSRTENSFLSPQSRGQRGPHGRFARPGACARAYIWGYEHSRSDPQNLQIPRTPEPHNTRRGMSPTHAPKSFPAAPVVLLWNTAHEGRHHRHGTSPARASNHFLHGHSYGRKQPSKVKSRVTSRYT